MSLPNIPPLPDLKPELQKKFRAVMSAAVNVGLTHGIPEVNQVQVREYQKAESDFIEFLDKYVGHRIRHAK